MSFLSRRKNTPEEPAKKPKAKDPDDYLLALDIGTEFVKALIAKKGKGTMKIVGVGKAHEAPTNMYAGAISDISGVAKTCEEALVKAEEMAGVRAQEVVVGIAGELIKGNTTSVKFRRADASKPINDEEMHKIIKQVQKKAGERARREVAEETNNPDVEVRLINSALVLRLQIRLVLRARKWSSKSIPLLRHSCIFLPLNAFATSCNSTL